MYKWLKEGKIQPLQYLKSSEDDSVEYVAKTKNFWPLVACGFASAALMLVEPFSAALLLASLGP